MPHTPQLTSFAYQLVLLPPISDGKPLLPYNVKHNILSLLYLENNVLSFHWDVHPIKSVMHTCG